MEMLRLQVRRRTLLLDRRDFLFITDEGVEILKICTEDVVRHVERWVARRMRGSARVHGRAQLLQALRQFNSPKEGLTQFVLVEEAAANRLVGLVGSARQVALDEAVVRLLQVRHPVDLLSVERWARLLSVGESAALRERSHGLAGLRHPGRHARPTGPSRMA